MPSDFRNSLGFLGLQLKAKRLEQEQQQEIATQQFQREAQQQDFTNALAVGKQNLAGLDAAENRKLQIATMLQNAQLSDATKRRGQDLTNEDRDSMRGLKESQDAIKNEVTRLAAIEAERHHKASEGTADTRNMVAFTGQQNSQTGAARNQVIETNDAGLPTKVAPAAGPPPGTTPISKPTRAKEEQEIAGLGDMAPYFTRLIERLHQPESAQYFGVEEGGVAIPKDMPLVGGLHLPGSNLKHTLPSMGIGSAKEVAAAKGYNEIKQMMSDLENAKVLEQSGKVVNVEELGRVQEAMGRLRNAPFSTKLEIMLPALEQAYESLRSAYARKNQQLQQGYMPGTLPEAGRAPPGAFVPNKDIMTRAAADPVVSRKLRELEARMPKSATPEWRAQALQHAAEAYLGQVVSPQ